MERIEISQWREKYLRSIYTKRQEGKPIIYLDETYVHLNYKTKKSWQGPSVKGVTENISAGKRYIVVHAGSDKGWVPNALLVFSTKSQAADYHHDMNAQNFTKWVKEKLIPNLHEPSVIVMDNAKYHVRQTNKPPTTQDLKATIQNWLTTNGIAFDPAANKRQLMTLVNTNKSPACYETEEILKAHGHEVLKLPPYHCDLNAIELAWSMAKRTVAKRNLGIPAADMQNLITDCFLNQWKRFTDHVINVEEEYRTKDRIAVDHINRFVIHVDDEDESDENDSETDSFYEEVEYLDSEYELDL
ncbi:uncharacterized protein LOC134657732 [Cydia amplana]|uniref:uncharacterized protein LOC134657732 n=1 Tax=Cydia amplana TaxID=1869771 RepID=UPI002FE5492C